MSPTRLEQAAMSIDTMITMLGIHAAVQQAREAVETAPDDLPEALDAEAMVEAILERQAAMMAAAGLAAEA